MSRKKNNRQPNTPPNTISNPIITNGNTNNQELEKEYMMLREEIMYITKRRESIIQHTYTVGLGLFAAAFAANIAWINLCIIPLVLSASLRATEYGNSLSYLASYVEVFLESKLDIKWETMNRKYLSRYKKKGFLWFQHFAGRCDFLCLVLISCALFWIERQGQIVVHGSLSLGIIVLILQIVVICFELYLVFYYVNNKRRKNLLIENWQKLK